MYNYAFNNIKIIRNFLRTNTQHCMQDYILEIAGVKQKMVYVETPKERLLNTEFYWTDIGKGFPKGYWIGDTPVTQEFWMAVMGEPWSKVRFTGKKHPVESVSWRDLMGEDGKMQTGFFFELNKHPDNQIQMAVETEYKLPSEAQWEFAARGGMYGIHDGFRYAGSKNAAEVGWYDRNSNYQTKPVALKLPNQLELYDMSGNVREWCMDEYSELDGLSRDGHAMQEASTVLKLLRGGSWYSLTDYVRVSIRNRSDQRSNYDIVGFRLARY